MLRRVRLDPVSAHSTFAHNARACSPLTAADREHAQSRPLARPGAPAPVARHRTPRRRPSYVMTNLNLMVRVRTVPCRGVALPPQQPVEHSSAARWRLPWPRMPRDPSPCRPPRTPRRRGRRATCRARRVRRPTRRRSALALLLAVSATQSHWRHFWEQNSLGRPGPARSGSTLLHHRHLGVSVMTK